MQVLYERGCGLDVHKKSVVACVLTPEGSLGPRGPAPRLHGHMGHALLEAGDVPVATCADTKNGIVGIYAVPAEHQSRTFT